MLSRHFDSPKMAIGKLQQQLGTSFTQLAGLLGVSERTLTDWKARGPGDLPPRAARLLRLANAVQKIIELEPGADSAELLSILNNGDVMLQNDADDEVDAVPLIEYLRSCPDEAGWIANVESAVEDHRKFRASKRG